MATSPTTIKEPYSTVDKRKLALLELVTTERNYFRYLLVLSTLYIHKTAPQHVRQRMETEKSIMSTMEADNMHAYLSSKREPEIVAIAPEITATLHSHVSSLARVSTISKSTTTCVASEESAGGEERRRLRHPSDILNETNHSKVFGFIAGLVPLHRELLRNLEKAIIGCTSDCAAFHSINADEAQGCSGDTCCGHVFSLFGPMFRMYQPIITGYAAGLKSLNQILHSNAAFAEAVRDAESSVLSDNQNLQSLLIMPVQRLPRYSLLLREVLRHTDTKHADFAALTRALSLIDSVLAQLNSGVHHSEQQARVLEVERLLEGSPNLCAPHRKVIREGKLRKISPKGWVNEHYFVLFSDLLVYGKRKFASLTSKYAFRYAVTLESVDAVVDKDVSHAFTITGTHTNYKDTAFSKAIICTTTTAAEQVAWVADMQAVIDECARARTARRQSMDSVGGGAASSISKELDPSKASLQQDSRTECNISSVDLLKDPLPQPNADPADGFEMRAAGADGGTIYRSTDEDVGEVDEDPKASDELGAGNNAINARNPKAPMSHYMAAAVAVGIIGIGVFLTAKYLLA